MQQDIDRRKTDRKDLDTIEEVAEWAAQHNGKLPIQCRHDHVQYVLSQRLRRLQNKETKSPMLLKRLDELTSNVHMTATSEGENDVTNVFKQDLAWMDDHDDVLPHKTYTNPTPEQQEEVNLRQLSLRSAHHI